MVQSYFRIRFKQIFRELSGLGLVRIAFLSGLSVFITSILFHLTAKAPGSFYTAGVYMIFISLVHIKRTDQQFLKIHFRNFRLIFLTEYLLFLVPLFICLVSHAQWLPAIVAITLVPLIALLNFKQQQKSLNTMVQRLIPAGCFEWKSGVRRTFFLLAAFWMGGLGASFFVGSVPVAILVLGILSMSFYEKGEPIQMIVMYEMNANKFLLYKIRMHILLFLILSMPLILVFLMFHKDKWYIPVIELFVFLNIQVYVILTKYAFYKPNLKSGGVQIFEALGAVGIIIPFFLPVIWLLSIRFYFQSKENLNFYLNDFN